MTSTLPTATPQVHEEPPPVRMVQLLAGFQVSQALYCVAELGVSSLLLEGRFTTNEITRLLGIPEGTVKRHATNIYSKLQVTGREDAVLRAYDLGVLRPEDRETPPSD